MQITVLAAIGFSKLATAAYDEYILAPTSRTIIPSSVYQVNGTVDNAEALLVGAEGTTTFRDDSTVTYDFGKVSLLLHETLCDRHSFYAND